MSQEVALSLVNGTPSPTITAATPLLHARDNLTQPRPPFGIPFCLAGSDELVDEIVRNDVPTGAGLRTVITANLDHIVKLRGNAQFRAAYAAAWRVTIDGSPVQLYARLRGLRVPERVTGADLLPKLLARLVPGRHKLFLVLGSEETAEGVLAVLREAGSKLAVDYAVVPQGFGSNRDYNAALTEQVREHGTTHLFMGVGAPKSEIWMHEHRHQLGDCYGMAFGAAFDFVAGTRARAPRAMRAIGMEWIWRLASEPKRLARRYLVDSWGFLGAIGDDLAGRWGR